MALLPRTNAIPIPPPAPLPRYLASRGYSGEGRSLKLKRVLLNYGLTIAEMSRAIVQANGVVISRPSMQQLITYGIVPAKTPFADIRVQAELWLAEKGVPAAEIATAFDVENGVVDLDAHPVSFARAKSAADLVAQLRAAGVDEALIEQAVASSHRSLKYRSSRGRSEAPADPDLTPLEKVMLTTQARKHFAIPDHVDPFTEDIDTAADLYLGSDYAKYRERLWAWAQGARFGALIGEPGAGKSWMREELEDRIKATGEPVRIIRPLTIDAGKLTAGLICQAIIHDLSKSAKVPRTLESQSRLVIELLKANAAGGGRALLLVEQAHKLTIAALKHTKDFYELKDGFRRLLSVVLIGQSELGELLVSGNRETREVTQRIEQVHVVPLHPTVIEAYVTHKLARAGLKFGDIFDKTALDGLRMKLIEQKNGKLTRNNCHPLAVNNALAHGMNAAAKIGAPKVNAELVLKPEVQ